jgi:hypothetical protein
VQVPEKRIELVRFPGRLRRIVLQPPPGCHATARLSRTFTELEAAVWPCSRCRKQNNQG